MRVISGKYKGKKLNQPIDKITRPLKDVVKESIFNLILHSKKLIIKIDEANILTFFLVQDLLELNVYQEELKK